MCRWIELGKFWKIYFWWILMNFPSSTIFIDHFNHFNSSISTLLIGNLPRIHIFGEKVFDIIMYLLVFVGRIFEISLPLMFRISNTSRFYCSYLEVLHVCRKFPLKKIIATFEKSRRLIPGIKMHSMARKEFSTDGLFPLGNVPWGIIDFV